MNKEKDLIKVKKMILELLQLIKKEYKVSEDLINDIIDNIDNKVYFQNSSISFFVSNGKLYLPELAYSLLKSNGNKTNLYGVNIDDYLNTQNTYYDYINHVINDNLTPFDYFSESLLHEVMHLCGGKGGNPLQEGINELKTRELAKKYRLCIAATGYQKEVEVALKLQKIIGKSIMDVIAFKSVDRAFEYIKENDSIEHAELFLKTYSEMIKVNDYYQIQIESITNPYDKARLYETIDYSGLTINNQSISR